MKANDYIDINEISNFEKYAIKRFNIAGVDFKIDVEPNQNDEITENITEDVNGVQDEVKNSNGVKTFKVNEIPPVYKDGQIFFHIFQVKILCKSLPKK